MKKIITLAVIGLFAMAAAPPEPAEIQLIGAWKCVKSQYGDEKMLERGKDNDIVIKIFTKTRWSGTFFDKTGKKFDGSGGGTYTIKGDLYTETVEYFSWESEAVGKRFSFTLKMENGMLHQKGIIEYKGNLKYLVDEWYTRID